MIQYDNKDNLSWNQDGNTWKIICLMISTPGFVNLMLMFLLEFIQYQL